MRLWESMPRPVNPYRCPYCAEWFVVESMTEFHVINNQCGLVKPPVSGGKK
jgi:hypothetical protein